MKKQGPGIIQALKTEKSETGGGFQKGRLDPSKKFYQKYKGSNLKIA